MSDDMVRQNGTELGKPSPTSCPQPKRENEKKFAYKETKW